MPTDSSLPRGLGDNRPPEAAQQAVTDRLADEYGELAVNAQALIESAAVMPEEVRDEAMLQAFANVIVAIRDAGTRAEAARVAEKEPYLRSGQAVDGWFTTIKERLERARLSLKRRVDEYQLRKLAVERERRRLEAEQRARDAQEARAREERARREAEEARLAAARARLPENREQKAAIADEIERAASQAAAAAAVAADAAEGARIETLRTPAELARSRFEEGRLVTIRQVPYVELIDRDDLDLERLRPFFREADLLHALRGWAKSTGHSRPMRGAIIEMRDDSVVR